MATNLTISQENAQVGAAAENGSQAGLTAEPDSLTAVLDSIEQSVAQAARSEEVFSSPRITVVFHHPPCH